MACFGLAARLNELFDHGLIDWVDSARGELLAGEQTRQFRFVEFDRTRLLGALDLEEIIASLRQPWRPRV